MASGDYEVFNGFALVPPDDPDVWGLGQWSEGEAFGMYLPEAPGLYGLDGCGGRCPEPRVLTGGGRFVAPRAVATHERDIADRFTTLEGVGDMGEGLVQMIEGLSCFGDLGYVEDLAYGDLDDLSEGYPLGQVEIGPEGSSGWSDEPYQDYAPAPPPDNADIPQVDTPTQAELADILEQRRQAIADAIKQRNLLTQKVTDLDHQIVEVLNPQYQQALASGDEETAVKLGGELRVLNLKRTEAVQKALEWAQFQATAAQLAKNVKAQLTLNRLYQQVQTRRDPQFAQAIAEAYAEIGRATGMIKAARQQALEMQKANEAQMAAEQTAMQRQGEVAQAQTKLAAVQQRVQALQTQYAAVVKEVAALKAKAGMKIIPKAKTDLMQKLALLLKTAKAQVQKAQAEVQAKTPLLMQAQAQMPYAQQGYGYDDPYAGYDQFQGLDGLDATVPYCTLYTRDAYGPTCMKSTTMQLGNWSEFAYPSLAAGLADIGSAWDVVGKVAGSTTQAVVEEAARRATANKSKRLCTLECYKLGGPTWQKDQALCIAKCEAGGGAPAPLVPNPFVPQEKPVWGRWWFFPLCIAVGGVGYGLYRGLKAPRGVNGLAGFRRKRRRSHRR